ncbi:MAG: hypothetical protein H0V46_01870 [Sphingomonas sp.]|nr:hypothetical protein [Sphingomonas sp.]
MTATGGQAPSFDIETGSVGVGTRDAAIKVPEIRVNPAGEGVAAQNQVAPAQPVQNQAAPANAF